MQEYICIYLYAFFMGKNEENGIVEPLSANPTKWSNTLKQIVGKLPTNCLSVYAHFLGLALKGLKTTYCKTFR